MKRFLLLILLLPALLVAGEYSLDGLIEHGIAHSYQIQKEELSAGISASSLSSAKWNMVPEVALNAGISQDFDPAPARSATSSNAGISVSKSISLNDPAYFAYRQALIDKNSAALKLQQGYKSYVYQVFQAYLEVLSAQKRKQALEENQAIQSRVLEQSQLLLRLGKVTPFEVKQNEIALMNSQISILQLENSISNSRAKLFALVRMDDEGFDLQDLEVDLEKSIPALEQEQILEHLLLKQELKRQDLTKKQNSLDDFPSLSLSYNYSRRVSGEDFDFDQYSTSHGLNLGISYSLWNYFRHGENKTRAKINRQITEMNLSDSQEQTQREYESIVKELQYLLRLEELNYERLQQSTQQVSIAEERYRLGLIQLLDLDKTRTDYIAADIDYHTNRYQIIAKQEALNFLLSGNILGKW